MPARGPATQEWSQLVSTWGAVYARVFRDPRCRPDLQVARLEQPDRPPFGVDIDILKRGSFAESRHPLHVAAEGDDEAGAGRRQQRPDGNDESRRTIAQRWVVRQRHLRLRDADGRG